MAVKYPSIWLKFSDDLLAWEDKPSHLLIAGREGTWEEKIGGSTPPILTEAGWLTLYHGVADGGTAEYRVGALLLDRENPLRVLARTPEPILEPEFFYETEGFYSHCVFPTGNVVVDGVLYVYYGGADKYVGVATCRLGRSCCFLFQQRVETRERGPLSHAGQWPPYPMQRQRRCFPCVFGCKTIPWCKIFFILVK